MLGYGTPGVASYMGDGQAGSLQARTGQCQQVSHGGAAAQTSGLAAACSQLHRTLRNQPGNSVR